MGWISFDCRKELPGFRLEARWESSRTLVALLGRSGSGKTLTLRCIAGLERPDRGTIRVGERLLFDSERGVSVPVHRRRVGLVFQHYALFPHLTVRDNLLFALPGADPAARAARLREMLALCRLDGLAGRYPRELSGGQRQRVAIGRALASDPAVLLLDEPFAALDRQTRDEVLGELRAILERSRVPTVMVTHDAEEAAALGEEVVLMDAGRALSPPEACPGPRSTA
ncbi:MAG: ATP-binding cassette domain-containing protein [Gemmatimonadota bacterium]